MDVKQAVTDYLATITRLRPGTQVFYERRLRMFAMWCEAQGITLEQITHTTTDRFVQHLYETHTSSYRNKPRISSYTATGYIRVIKIFLNWCLDHETYGPLVQLAAIKRIKLPKREQFLIRIFTDAQIQALFAVCEREHDEHLQVRDRTMLALLFDCGIRANELCTLTLENTHLDADDAYILVMGKGRREREIGLGTFARQALQTYISEFRSTATAKAPVFIGRYHERALSPDGLKHLLRRLGCWAKIEGVRCSPHTCRHTYASKFITQEGEGSILSLSLLMGHSTVKTTEDYLKSVRARQVRKKVKSILDTMGMN